MKHICTAPFSRQHCMLLHSCTVCVCSTMLLPSGKGVHIVTYIKALWCTDPVRHYHQFTGLPLPSIYVCSTNPCCIRSPAIPECYAINR